MDTSSEKKDPKSKSKRDDQPNDPSGDESTEPEKDDEPTEPILELPTGPDANPIDPRVFSNALVATMWLSYGV